MEGERLFREHERLHSEHMRMLGEGDDPTRTARRSEVVHVVADEGEEALRRAWSAYRRDRIEPTPHAQVRTSSAGPVFRNEP